MPDLVLCDHAILRWLERVHSIDVDGFRRDLAAIEDRPLGQISDRALVDWILAYLNLDRGKARKSIITQFTKTAWKAGAKTASHDGFVVVFESNRVVTVLAGTRRSKAKPGGRRRQERNKKSRERSYHKRG